MSERDRAFAQMVSDLDRCPHGRHEGDVCGGPTGCNGPSVGNIKAGTVIGYTISGVPYVMPERGQRHDPDAWLASSALSDTDGAS